MNNMDSLVQKHPEIGELRRPDKAMVYLIISEDLEHLEIKRATINENLDKILKFSKKEFDLRRGDLIYISSELPKGSLNLRNSELKENDNGKYLYTGKNLIRPNKDDSVPDIFQVITEFPIRYWEGRLKNTFVPFNVKENIGTIKIDNILRIRRFPYFRFIRNGEDYVLTVDYKYDKNEITDEEFLRRLAKAEYFSYIPIEDKSDYLKLGDWRNILYLPLKL